MSALQPATPPAENTAPRPTTRVRLDYVDGLRACAALYVVLAHAFYQPANGYYANPLLYKLGLTFGQTAVAVFIVISGFCLMLPIARKEAEGQGLTTPIGEFYYRRARRILPPYYAALLLSILFIVTLAHEKTGTVWDNSLPLTPTAVFQHIFLLHDLFTWEAGGRINYPLWSVAVEVHIYLLMPLLLLSFRTLGHGATVAWTGLTGLTLHHLSGRYWHLHWYIVLFLLGAIAARVVLNHPALFQRPHWRPLMRGLGMLGVVLLITLGNRLYNRTYQPYFDYLVGVTTALLLATTYADVSTRRFRLTRLLAWRPLVRIGEFSYSLYLLHAPLLHAFWLLFWALWRPPPVLMFGLLLGTIPFIIGLSYLFFLVFEKPFLSTRKAIPPSAVKG